jgi:hypothetical protein
MNEQIYKIARRADALAREIEPNLREIALYKRIRDEKFAELIVKECCDIVGDYYGQSKKSGPGYTMICEIKEHFGVEE